MRSSRGGGTCSRRKLDRLDESSLSLVALPGFSVLVAVSVALAGFLVLLPLAVTHTVIVWVGSFIYAYLGPDSAIVLLVDIVSSVPASLNGCANRSNPALEPPPA